MTVTTSSHILIDEKGRAVVAGTRTKVVLIARDTSSGMTPQQIHETYPNLTLAQIHAALTYYYDHQAELDAQIVREDQEVEALGKTQQQSSRSEMERRRDQRNNHGRK